MAFVVPTLGSQTLLTDVPQILVYQLRQYITMPKSRSDLYTDQIISFSDDTSRLGYDKDSLAQLAQDNLTSVYNRIFFNSNIRVTVSCSAEKSTGSNYQLNIYVQATDNITIWEMAPVIISSGGSIQIENDTVSTTPLS